MNIIAEMSDGTRTTTEHLINGLDPSIKYLFLIRGLPSQGKTTLAAALVSEANKFEADDFFVDAEGVYRFDGAKLGAAHASCQARCEAAMREGKHPLAVANTFTRHWEMESYLALAKQYGYAVAILEPVTPWRRDVAALAARNTHGVPVESIKRMLDRWEISS